jgi:hypothetical protein
MTAFSSSLAAAILSSSFDFKLPAFKGAKNKRGRKPSGAKAALLITADRKKQAMCRLNSYISA